MHNDAVHNLRRCQHQEAVEIKIPLRRTAAPPGPLITDRYPPICDPYQSGVMPHPLRYDLHGFIRELLHVFICQRRHFRNLLRMLLHQIDVLQYPLAMAADKSFYLGISHMVRRPHDDAVAAHLKSHGLPAAPHDFIIDAAASLRYFLFLHYASLPQNKKFP